MKSLFSEYSFIILSAIVVTLLVSLASPVGASVKDSVTGLITKFAGTSESLSDSMNDTVIDLNNNIAGEEVSQVTLISFTIDGVTYQAEEGMTWLEWFESPYANDEFEKRRAWGDDSCYYRHLIAHHTEDVSYNNTGRFDFCEIYYFDGQGQMFDDRDNLLDKTDRKYGPQANASYNCCNDSGPL